MEHEQDTVLQLQEVIEQLRNVFPSEPGESQGPRQNTLCTTPSTLRGRESGRRRWRPGERRANTRLRGRADRKIKVQRGGVGGESQRTEMHSVTVVCLANHPVLFETQFACDVQSLEPEQRKGLT